MTYIEKQEKLQKKAVQFLKKHTKQESYDFATWILHELQNKGFCIWQTYTKYDIESNLGHKPTDDEMQELSDSLQCFENIII